jgi:branched-chain amino acid transport system permease protein
MQLDLIATAIALLTFFSISGLMALSLNLEYGLAGIPNFGKALFVSIGAYTAGWTYTRLLPLLNGADALDPCGLTMGQALQGRSEILRTLPLHALGNFAITLFIAALIGGAVGWLASYPALRLKEEWYLALVLLVGSEILRIVVRGYDPLVCGTNGLSGIAQPFAWMGTLTGSPRVAALCFLGLTLLLLAGAYVYAERLVRSPFGRLLKAVRENPDVTQELGKNVPRIRAGVMFIGSALAAVAGVLFAVNLGFVSTNDYAVALTLDVWVMVVLGGVGNNRGALLGAAIVTLLDRVTAITAIRLDMLGSPFEFNYVRFILFGVILLLMLRYRREGLLPEPVRTTGAHEVLAKEGAADSSPASL